MTLQENFLKTQCTNLLLQYNDSLFGTSFLQNQKDGDIKGIDIIQQFMTNEDLRVMCAFIESKTQETLQFALSMQQEESYNIVIFCKIKPRVLTQEFVRTSIHVISLKDRPTLALFTSLGSFIRDVIPEGEHEELNEKLDLDICSKELLAEEISHWKKIKSESSTGNLQSHKEIFTEILEPLAEEWSFRDPPAFQDFEELLQRTHNVLDHLWQHKSQFPADKVKRIMDIIEINIIRWMKLVLSECDIWLEEYAIVEEILVQCINSCKIWVNNCKQLTQIFWPNYTSHQWNDGIYVPGKLEQQTLRFEEVLSIRRLYKQLLKLLSPQERTVLDSQQLFHSFRELDILSSDQHFVEQWLKVCKQFENSIQSTEQQVALKLKKKLISQDNNVRQLLYEFNRYSELINRATVRQTLLGERQQMLIILSDYINAQTSSQIDVSVLSTKYDIPQVIKELLQIRILENRLFEIKEISEKHLSDLDGYMIFKNSVTETTQFLKMQHLKLFETWSNQVLEQIKDKSLSLKESDQVVQFSENKLMKITYPVHLISLISEVQKLEGLGYRIPVSIQELTSQAKKFVKVAKILEQIANFHNTIGDKMITSQRPMMLSSAVDLSNLVQGQDVVSWSDIESVENYVGTFKAAVKKLSNENNMLASYHYHILNKVKMLEEIDLLKNYSKWKETSKEIKSMVTLVENKGFRNTEPWKNDIDQKIAEVLEKQFIKCLQKIHLYLPEIQGELIYRNSEINFSPTEDELKQKYQQSLKNFLDIPKHFHGISYNSGKNIYSEIINRNEVKLEEVQNQTQALFNQLNEVKKRWKVRLQLEPLDVNKLSSWQDWDLHFRASKMFAQQIANFSNNEEIVGCFIIRLVRLRTDLESYNRSYWDQLVSTLKTSISEDISLLQEFIDSSTSSVTKQPVTLQEIGEANDSHSRIIKETEKYKARFTDVEKKLQVLSSWTKEQVHSAVDLKTSWDRLMTLLDNQEHIISKQMETVKATIYLDSDNLSKEIDLFATKWNQFITKLHSGEIMTSRLTALNNLLDDFNAKKHQWNDILEKKNKLIENCTKCNLEFKEISQVELICSEIEREEMDWKLFEEFQKDLADITVEKWIIFRQQTHVFDDFIMKWKPALDKNNSKIITRILQELTTYEMLLTPLKCIANGNFNDKHWMDIFSLLHMNAKPIELLTVGDFLAVSSDLAEHYESLQVICKKAANELIVQQTLSELDNWDFQFRFSLVPYMDSSSKQILLAGDFENLLDKIGDNQTLVQSLKNSADYENFSERLIMWENKLIDLDFFIANLAQIQKKWMYLEPVLSCGTLQQEKTRFDKIDKEFRRILAYIERDTKVSSLCRFANLRSILDSIQSQLGICQRSLDDFLKEKRNVFPRLYFLSDEDLLQIIGQSSSESVLQVHLKKIFSGINTINVDHITKKINSVCSVDDETLHLNNPVAINKSIEEWLRNLELELRSTLKRLLIQCKENQTSDSLEYPVQILCLSENINFTSRCEQAISNMTLPSLISHYKSQLAHYNSLEDKKNAQSIKSNEPLKLKLEGLILSIVYYISVLEKLIDKNVIEINDWTWIKQLRFYSNSSGEITVKMGKCSIEYSYEYLGNHPKLVRTHLIEKCFLALTQGMFLGMGGNPYGPAGTGKTESIKALGGLLGRQVLVFNCDEAIDAQSMGRILSGLVRSGAWGCFDEFNRLDEATLSVISMYIHQIQESLRMDKSSVVLLQEEIPINKHCGIFVTLNPAGDGYGGRNKLPDNLKQLFKPVIMTEPNSQEIAKCLLLSYGYKNSDLIAKKLIEVFSLSSKMLSQQKHYDWGLRAIRTILTGCGRIMREQKEIDGDILKHEISLVVRILRISTLPKLIYSDSAKFDQIISDVFKSDISASLENGKLLEAIQESCPELGLIPNKRQIDKCFHLYEQMKERMGVAVVGPPCSGKSTLIRLLSHALYKIGSTVKTYTLNPKSVTKQKLLGYTDRGTKQWKDGILTKICLQANSTPQEVLSWVICDGDVDPEWIESLNTVLDDNRLLSVPSGWCIQFGTNTNFLFETHSLDHASPATISRIGIIFLTKEDVSLTNYFNGYFRRHADEFSESMQYTIHDILPKALTWLDNNLELIIPQTTLSVGRTALSQTSNFRSVSEFTVKLIIALNAEIQQSSCADLNRMILNWTQEHIPNDITLCRYNQDTDSIEWFHSNLEVKIIELNGLSCIPCILTSQLQQAMNVLCHWLELGSEQHFLLVGDHATAKTLLLKCLVKERSDMELVTIYCGTALVPDYVISKITQYCNLVNTNKGKIYRPKRGRLILHFKNLHLLQPDEWGSNILIQFLQQIITYNHLFDTNQELVGIENVTIVGTLLPTNNLPIRFSSSVHVFNIGSVNESDLLLILPRFLSSILRNFGMTWSDGLLTKIANVLISVYTKVKVIFTQRHYMHYSFSLHDITKWCLSLLRYETQSEEHVEDHLFEVIYYEAVCLFGNKLTKEDDMKRFEDILNNTFQDFVGQTNVVTNVMKYYYVPLPVHVKFGSTITLYRTTRDQWYNIIERSIIKAGDQHSLDIIISKEILDLTAAILRSVSKIDGHIILLGRVGVGRRTAINLASTIYSAQLIMPSSNQQPQLNNEIKQAMQIAGIEFKQVYLVLQEHILTKDVLNALNILISIGEVPGLYSNLEMDSMVAALQDEAARENYEGTLTQYFAERVRIKLHIIVCLDADNHNLWEIFHNCPAFMHICDIFWKNSWSIESTNETPQMLIKKMEIRNPDGGKVISCGEFINIFNLVSLKMPSPYRFISMIRLYFDVYVEKLSNIISIQNKLKAGISKLMETHNVVLTLREEAILQQKKLSEKQSKANNALNLITNTMKNANKQKEEMEALKVRTEKENVQLMKRKEEIERELREVEPLLQEARQAVGNIKTEALSEIRSLRAPPEIIRDILEGVLRLMGTQDTSWNSMKVFLAKRGVKEEIKLFDATRISSENRQIVERLMSTKPDSFDPKLAKRASLAAAPLANWVLANVKYSHVMDRIKPLEREQSALQENLETAESQLGELSAALTDVDQTVERLKQQLSTYTKEAAEIEISLSKAQHNLESAEGLVSKLSDEFTRWKEQLEDLEEQVTDLPINCLLTSAFITYLSCESEATREAIFSKCLTTAKKDKFNVVDFLYSDRDQLQWQTEGLSPDNLSRQNAAVLLRGNIFPLVIDPTSLAIKWLKNHFGDNKLEITTQESTKFNKTLELAVRFGKLLIIEGVEHISPILLTILRGVYSYEGERKLIKLNGVMVDYHKSFKVIFHSRNEHLQLPPDVEPLLTIVTFRITISGLSERLLTAAVLQENPDLEQKRIELTRERSELKEKQHKLQSQLLEDLINAGTDILSDSKLLESLNATKASSVEISSALEESVNIQNKLSLEYDAYKSVCEFASNLYFIIKQFAKLNVLYLYSIEAYVRLFLRSLQSFQGFKEKYHLLKKHILQTVYRFILRGIFKRDRIKFALHILHNIYKDEIDVIEWNIFLGIESGGIDDSNTLPAWINNRYLQNIQSVLPGLYTQLKIEDELLWKEFMSQEDCENHFPKHCGITSFQKVLVVAALRPDRLLPAILNSLLHFIGFTDLDYSVSELQLLLNESVSSEPVLIITTTGNDPSSEIRALADKTIGQDKYSEISMATDQESNALTAIEKYSKNGHWLILKNLHLVMKWIPILCQKLQSIQTNENFRLWLITEPHQQFNTVLSQNSLKIVYEPPKGVRNNLLHVYSTWGADIFRELNSYTARVFFALSSIHAIFQERRTYIPQGWLKWYEFNDSDFSTVLKLTTELWNNKIGSKSQIQWKLLSDVCSEVVYGSKVETNRDMKMLRACLEKYFKSYIFENDWHPFGLKLNSLKTVDFQEYIKIIKELPTKDSPSSLNLPDNIDKMLSKVIISDVKCSLRNLQTTVLTDEICSKENTYKALAPFKNHWKKLNTDSDFIRMEIPHIQEGKPPIKTFLEEEYQYCIILIHAIHKTFTALNRANKHLHPDEFPEFNALLNHKIPVAWSDLWNGPHDPTKYMTNVIDKAVYLMKLQNLDVSNIIGTPISLASLFRPEAFIAAFKLEFASKRNICADQVCLQTSWKIPPENFAICLTDLFIEGALFNGKELKPCSLVNENMNRTVECYIYWEEETKFQSIAESKNQNFIDVPLYYSPGRTKEITSLCVPCAASEQEQWILYGVAFFIEN